MALAALDHSPLRDVHDFLDWLSGREGRFEFVDGRIVAMAGASLRHGELQTSLLVALGNRLRGGRCRLYGSDALIRTDAVASLRGRFADVVIERGPRGHERLIERPLVVVEILSTETEAVDRGEKLGEYQALSSLQHYVLVAQDRPRVEVYSRHEDGAWLYRAVEGLEAVLRLDEPTLEVPLAELWQGIDAAETV